MASSVPRTASVLLARTLGLAVVIGLCAWWSIVYTRGALGFSSLWVGSGVLCGVLLTSPRREWLPYLLGAFAASLVVNILLNGLSQIGIVLSFANTLDAWIVAAAVASRVNDVSDLTQLKSSFVVAIVATLVACTVSGLIASVAGDDSATTPAPFAGLFLTWFASHLLGMGIFATLTIAACVEGLKILGQPGQRVELAATLGLVAVVCWLVFAQSRFAVTFLVFPPLMLCVFRHRFSGFVPATGIVAVIATMQTAAGHGPFMVGEGVSDLQRTLMLQAFIANVSLLAFPIAVAVTERKLLMHRLARREHDYRLLADHSSDLVSHIAAGNQRRYISPSVFEMLGWTREEFAEPRWDLIHPEDLENVLQIFDAVSRTGVGASVECRMQHKHGHYVWMELKVRRVPGEGEGEAPGIVFAGRDITKRREYMVALERQARHDVLTGLGNRLYFNERMDLAIARSSRSGKALALLYLDIDHFKRINDTHGHAVGDAVLREFAVRLLASIRATDFAARLGGDEFVVLVDDIDAPDAPQAIAEKLISSLRNEIVVGQERLSVTTSIGIAEGTVFRGGRDELLQRADAALYEAKLAGRNTWCIKTSNQDS
ncbi:sensor domain-containing diguanylate cyclase [Thermomonas sp.]|uniref:sensor domain-containing diguanylate cyclase n=1 Tax=Thermomonas sp. TaxID=1971895 RepID=UPI0024898830|nr:sensor domain-containing diguanylate cyclase [Thermomonas sp.]MDI1253969.1 diguanylate cyclase [Thermomonas sp.]